MPEVSVIIPTYRHRDYVLATLDAVFAQTFQDFEIIVINDGSPDDTGQLLRPLAEAGKIRYLEQPNAGQAAARNRGLKEARGRFIALLDDDDLWPPDKLEWQVDVMRRKPHVGAVVGDRVYWDGRTPPPPPPTSDEPRLITFEGLFSGNPIASPGQALLRGDIMARLGGFNPNIWGADDYDLWFRICRVSAFEFYDRIALLYRVHASNASHNLERMLTNCRTVLAEHSAAAAPARQFELRRAANRWLYQYAGERVVLRLKDEWARGDYFAALKSCRTLAAFSKLTLRDPPLLRRIGNDILPLRQMIKEKLPSFLVHSVRTVKTRSNTVVDALAGRRYGCE